MAVSKRLRHEIFRRDGHTCQSCGAKAPDVKLEPDHVIPVTLGGSDDPSNLRTLCADCNSGKSATPPDAATVAKVADDAMRWSQAIQAAAGDMLGKRHGRDEARLAFDSKWASWSEGRPPLPRPNGWEVSVDSFIKAGLPVPVLLDCVDIAMSRRHVNSGDLFKYTCGIAWKEVRKLQAAARGVLESRGAKTRADPTQTSALPDVDEVTRDLIELLSDEEKEDVGLDDRDMDALTEDGQHPIVEVVDALLCSMRADTAWLASSANELLEQLPGGIGEFAMKIARFRLYDRYELRNITRHRFADMALGFASHLLQVRDADAALDALTPEERAEWIAYARAFHDTQPRDGWYSEIESDTAIIHAAAFAEMLGSGGRRHRQMCVSRGEYIPACPRPAAYLVYIAELECCSEENESSHAGHRYCEHHTSLMVDGHHFTSSGERLAARTFKELDDE